MKCAAPLIIALGLGLAGCSGGACSTSGAEAVAKGLVRGQLKAPTTAQFSEISTIGGKEPTKAGSPACEYFVSGSVAAQNSYGAMLSNRFLSRVVYNQAQGRWEDHGTFLTP